jgi:hypothetical protein
MYKFLVSPKLATYLAHLSAFEQSLITIYIISYNEGHAVA